MSGKNGWSEYQRLVLSRLDEQDRALNTLSDELKELRTKDLVDLRVEIATLKVKSGIWGAIAGTIPSALALVYVWLKHVPGQAN